MIQPSDVVRVRDERWRVVHVASHDECTIVELAGAERSNAGRSGRFLLPFERIDRLPAAPDRPRVVRASVWRRVVRGVLAEATPAWTSLRAAATAQITLLPYQLEPALAMTRGLACRLLLADEVGLGKTIQAGLIVAEVLARERHARVLIVTPAGLREQWRDELRERFAIAAEVIDAATLLRASADLPPGINPWTLADVAIASIDFLKRADVIRALESLVWDLTVFDEAHSLSGRSDRAMAADLVARRARRVVLVTATPHNGDERAFERLRALGRMGAGDRLLTFRRSRTEAGLTRSRALRHFRISPAPDEVRMHRALAAYAAAVSREAPSDSRAAARLAMIVLMRRASSSAASLVRSIERRIALLGMPVEEGGSGQMRLPLDEGMVDEDDEPLDELAARGLPSLEVEQRWLGNVLALARAVRHESKIASLQRLLRRTREPAIVFTEYRDTLQQLAAALEIDAALLHGGLTTTERAREARRFTHGDTRLLLATDAASEGLNLHQRCRLVINLDVPWTPARLEQRVGRVDRLGQLRPVHGLTLVARGTAEERIASGLAARSLQAEHAAPFSAVGAETVSLRDDARDEVSRLAEVRRLAHAPKSVRQVSGGAALPPSRAKRASARLAVALGGGGQGRGRMRPVLTVLPQRSRCELLLALRLLFVDAAGRIVWETVVGTTVLTGAPANRTPRGLRASFESSLDAHNLSIAAASSAIHDAALAALRAELRQSISPLVARERAMLERLTDETARLAARLLQPGLFDRRTLRDADAQRRVAEEVEAGGRERIRRLEQLCDPSTGERYLAFAAAWSR